MEKDLRLERLLNLQLRKIHYVWLLELLRKLKLHVSLEKLMILQLVLLFLVELCPTVLDYLNDLLLYLERQSLGESRSACLGLLSRWNRR